MFSMISTIWNQLMQFQKEILQAVDHIDILINNAGRSILIVLYMSLLIVSMISNAQCKLNYFGCGPFGITILPHDAT